MRIKSEIPIWPLCVSDKNLSKFHSTRATIANLEGKIENLSATNTLMKEDLALCKRSLARETEQSRSLALQLEATKLLATPTSAGPIGPLMGGGGPAGESASPSASTDDSESSSSTSAASASASRRYPIDSVRI